MVKYWKVEVIFCDDDGDTKEKIWFEDYDDAHDCYTYFRKLPSIGSRVIPSPPEKVSLPVPRIYKKGEWKKEKGIL